MQSRRGRENRLISGKKVQQNAQELVASWRIDDTFGVHAGNGTVAYRVVRAIEQLFEVKTSFAERRYEPAIETVQ